MNPQTDCPLFKLSPELRNYIYNLVLTVQPKEGQDAVILRRHSEVQQKSPVQSSVLSILGTCHLINSEANLIFYANNTLRIDSRPLGPLWPLKLQRSDLPPFLKEVGVERLAAIRTFEVILGSMEGFTQALKRMRCSVGLRELRIVLNLRHTVPGDCREPLFVGEWFTERWHVKAAVKKMPLSLQRIILRIELECEVGARHAHQGYEEDRAGLEAHLNEVLVQRRAGGKAVTSP